MLLVSTLVLVVACSGPVQRAAPTAIEERSMAITASRGRLVRVPSELCPQAYLPGSEAIADDRPLDRHQARRRAREFVITMSRSTGVFLPPGRSDGEWTLGVLDEEPVAERVDDDHWELAFPFRCPARRNVARVVRVRRDGRVDLLYPPVRMPSWELFPIEGPPVHRDIQHPELVGVWVGGADQDGMPCDTIEFSYDGREVVFEVTPMRDWEFRTEDFLQRFPARWEADRLEAQIRGIWRAFAQFDERGRLVDSPDPDGCTYEPAQLDLCDQSSFSRPRPTIPPGLPYNTGPIMMRCDAAGNCAGNQRSLVEFVCALHAP